MRKILISFLVIILSFTSLKAQEAATVGATSRIFTIAFSAGADKVGYEPISTDNVVSNFETTLAFNVGGQMQFHIGRTSLRFAAFYTNKGYTQINQLSPDSIPADSSGLEKEITVQLGYLDIPVTLAVNIVNKDKIKYYVAAGIMGSLLITHTEDATLVNGETINKTPDIDPEPLYSMMLGTGIKYDFVPGLGIGVEGVYKQSFNAPFKDKFDKNPGSFGFLASLYINL